MPKEKKQFQLFALSIFASILCSLVPASAFASEITDAKEQLSTSVSEMSSLTKDIQDGKALCDAWQQEVDNLAAQALETQESIQSLSNKQGKVVAAIYKNGNRAGVLELLLSSKDISEFMKDLSYLEEVYSWRDSLIEEKRVQSQHLETQIAEIENKKAEQQQLIEQLEGSKAELTQKVREIEGQVDQLEAEQQAAFSEANELASAQLFDTGDTSGWQTGIASAYGGHSDPTAPVGSHTATGATVTESSMGVAVPMAWDNFRSYFGRKVEISYGGKSVIATVNDCGGMGGGSRSLDLQPGVFRAFGCETCDSWGLRTVSYRFL